ncbi:MAG: ATP-grasp domain-containing protein [Planctomycetes bacterium]|nr:ATP-grasp domain-containing protein [Planctomycetota bacterium]
MKQLNVLVTCVGRRVELVAAFRRAAERLRLRLAVLGTDVSWTSPAMHRVDRGIIIRPIAAGHYVEDLLDIVRRHDVHLLIPTIDPELPVLAATVDRFRAAGCCALVSSPRVVEICRDKLATHRTLRRAGVDVPDTWPWAQAMRRKKHRFPLFLKPRAGSAGVGSFIVQNLDELRTFGMRVHDAIVQEFVEGAEHTLDVYTGFDGRPRCAVPRKRLEVRTGEVSKGIIVKDPAIMKVGRRVAEVLGECRGVVTVQCIVSPRRRIRVIEINPRFGGGAPLAIHAGADFPRWILQELAGRRPRINPAGFRGDVAMLRYDESVFVERATTVFARSRAEARATGKTP